MPLRHPYRAVVVDDHPKMLKIASRLLASIPGVEVIGKATSGHDALDVVDRLRPNLVLMDLAMPGMDGLEATRRIAARPDAPAVIIMTAYDLPQYRDAALAAGARRFVAKSDLAEQLHRAILSLSSDLSGDETIAPP
jgi:DNA-binding NarL/FixJ family response regulator